MWLDGQIISEQVNKSETNLFLLTFVYTKTMLMRDCLTDISYRNSHK